MKQINHLNETFAVVPRECMFTRWRMEQTVNHKCLFRFVILHSMSINLIVNSEM